MNACRLLFTLNSYKEEMIAMRLAGKSAGISLLLAAGLLLGGCGQELKKENEQLKTQVAALQKENSDLKAQMMTLKGDNEAMKKQLDEMTQHMAEMQKKTKGAKAAKRK
jgi:hypothetical protein